MTFIIQNVILFSSCEHKSNLPNELEVYSQEEGGEEVNVRVLDILSCQPLRETDGVRESLRWVWLHLGGSPLTEDRAGAAGALSRLLALTVVSWAGVVFRMRLLSLNVFALSATKATVTGRTCLLLSGRLPLATQCRR